MAREVQEPTIERELSPGGSEALIYRHPAYAQISAGRVSGGAVLYGSDFVHKQYIRIRIGESCLRRSLSEDWPHARNTPYIEVDLSEAQWATFVSSLNVGQGVPCTVAYRDGQTVPGLPEPVDRSEQFATEARGKLDRAMGQLNRLRELVAATGMSKAKQADLLGAIDAARRDIGSNVEFVADQFAEHMERTVEAAKVEVNAYATSLVMRTGLQALAGGNTEPPLELAYSKP